MNAHDPIPPDSTDVRAVPDRPTAETPTATGPESPGDLIRKSLQSLVEPGDVVEVRILKTPKGTVSGYYNDTDALARVPPPGTAGPRAST